jgi:hypothetical protein
MMWILALIVLSWLFTLMMFLYFATSDDGTQKEGEEEASSACRSAQSTSLQLPRKDNACNKNNRKNVNVTKTVISNIENSKHDHV